MFLENMTEVACLDDEGIGDDGDDAGAARRRPDTAEWMEHRLLRRCSVHSAVLEGRGGVPEGRGRALRICSDVVS